MVKRFLNNNIHVKFELEDIENIKEGKLSGIETLSFELEEVDTSFIGEEFCLSNYTTGILCYSYYADKVFLLDFSDIENILMSGKTLVLYAKEPDVDEREIIEAEEAELNIFA